VTHPSWYKWLLALTRKLTYWLADPILRDHPFGSVAWFQAQKHVIEAKPLIQACYRRWYQCHMDDAATVPGPGLLVELGSGGSFLKRLHPEIISTDLGTRGVDLVCDARQLPLPDESVRALFLSHVYHHIPDIHLFIEEARRVLVPGGVVSIVDCAHTPFGRFFFSFIHPEPYLSHSKGWSFPQTGSLLDSNQALTWITLVRDRQKFQSDFPEFTVEGPELLPWFTYLASGGVNLRSMLNQKKEEFWRRTDSKLQPLDKLFAVHWHFCIRKRGSK
jgi:ubiquinone/menaquinone biosynthesis C-methylase UbiE